MSTQNHLRLDGFEPIPHTHSLSRHVDQLFAQLIAQLIAQLTPVASNHFTMQDNL